MASVSTNKTTGARRVLFENANGRRQSLYVGMIPARAAENIARRIEDMVIAAIHKEPVARITADWIAGLPAPFRKKVERLGLVSKRERQIDTLSELTTAYFDSVKVQEGTLTTYRQTETDLHAFFGKSRKLGAINPLESQRWRQSMEAKLSPATVARRVKTAKRIFAKAVKWKLIEENPLSDVKGGSESNKGRLHFVAEDVARKVMDHCPDAQWRLIFALSRWGGLRCPSEHLAIEWGDVNIEQRKFRVNSPKTGERWVPIFPELMKPFTDAYAEAKEGATHVVTLRQGARTNLRTGLKRILRRAGVSAWPRLFHNLRSTRQTELAEQWPIQVVCAWIGNSETIARLHYLQVTNNHFEAATMTAEELEKTTRKTTRALAVRDGTARQTDDENRTGATKTPLQSTGAGQTMTPTGLEQVTGFGRKHGKVRKGGAESGALTDRSSLPPELRMRIAARAIRNGFAALEKAHDAPAPSEGGAA